MGAGGRGAAAAAPIVKHCACGRTYTQAGWEALADRKICTFEWREVQEQRQCACGSHLAIVLEPGEPDPVPRQVWYFRATGDRVKVVAVSFDEDVHSVYYLADTGGGSVKVTTDVFWATFTKTAPARCASR